MRPFLCCSKMSEVKKHHIRQGNCSSRAPYREGRYPTAVKVYTINKESSYLLVQGVPALGTLSDLIRVFSQFGEIQEHRLLPDYPKEAFTEVYLLKYRKIQSARFAKKKLDDYSFYGGVLHVCYAPEYESIDDTREKLQNRRQAIAKKTRELGNRLSKVSKTSEPESESSLPENGAVNWTCSCMFVNEAGAGICRMCGTSMNDQTIAGNLKKSNAQERSVDQETSVNPAPESADPSNITHQSNPSNLNPNHHNYHGNFRHPPPMLPPPPRHMPPPGFIPPWQLPPWGRPSLPAIPYYPSQGQLNSGSYPINVPPPPNSGLTFTNTADAGRVNSLSFTDQEASLIKSESNQNVGNEEQMTEPLSNKMVIKQFKAKGAAPKFVPRVVADKNPSLNTFRQKIRDAVNETLRENACILGDLKGPRLPPREEEKRETFKVSETGSKSLDDTVTNIRGKVKQHSAPLPIPRILKVKKQKTS